MEKWYVGIGIAGCLYDSVRGPFDTEAEARQVAIEALADGENPNILAEIFSANPEEMGEDF